MRNPAQERQPPTLGHIDCQTSLGRRVREKRSHLARLLGCATLATVLALALCGFSWACEDPTNIAFSKPVATFVHPHKIWYVDEGLVSSHDVLLIWDQTAESLCFQFQTIHTNAHLCWLDGTAKRTASGLYEYSGDKCIVRLRLGKGRVRVEINDPSEPGRKFCNPADSDRYACGSNTGIGPAIYRAKRSR